jgi:hypothetical protein
MENLVEESSPGKANEWAVIAAMIAAICAVICAVGLCIMSVVYYLMPPYNPTTAAAVPQATLHSTPTFIPVGPVPPEDWDRVYRDSFINNANEWPEGLDVEDYGTVEQQIEDGYYRWSALSDGEQPAWWAWMRYGGYAKYADYYYAADARKVNGRDECNGYGLVFRLVDNKNFYSFIISDVGMYTVELSVDYDDYTIIPWTDTDSIRPGQNNHLAVLVEGADMSFFINDELVDQAHDDTLSTGTIGLTLSLYDHGCSAEIEFDTVEVYAPPGD